MRHYPDQIEIEPLAQPFDATLRIPGSKSLTNRAFLLAALADDESTVRRPLIADDTNRMLDALRALGFVIEDQRDAVRIVGRSGAIPAHQAKLNLGNAGTATRLLTAACCLDHGTYLLDGVARMRQRPIGELVEPLRQLGANITYCGQSGYPPLQIHAAGLDGGSITMKPTLSSQFISALLMAGPYMERGLTLHFDGPVTSRPYVELTLGLMSEFGVDATVDDAFTQVSVAPGVYCAADYTVEPDASSATYALAAAAAVPDSRVAIPDLGADSLQGDTAFAQVLADMGAGVTVAEDHIAVRHAGPLRGIDADLNHIPDAAMTVAALAVLAEGPTTIRNVGNWRVKETDRMAAMHAELIKLGAGVVVAGDDLTITPPAEGRIRPATIDTYDDHRMAMSFAVIGLARPGITINDPSCVAKTYPGFFDDLDGLRQTQGAGA